MAGLDIKHFDGGGAVETSQGAIQTTAPKSTGIAGKIALDPTQTEDILKNMQQYIDERQSPINTLMGGINKARAGLAGPSALTAYQQQENLQDRQIMDYRSQMAAYRAAQAQAKNEAEAYNRTNVPATGGMVGATPAGGVGGNAPAGGVTFPPEIQRQLDQTLPTDIAGKKAIEKRYLDTVVTERIKRENSPELDKLVPYAISGKEELITLRDAAELAKKNPNLPRNQQILVQASKAESAPAAAPGTNLGNMRPVGKSTGFQEPTTPDKDIARIDANLKSYGDKGINTLSGVISRWSPPNENDTPALIKNAAKFLGIDPNQPIDLQNPAVRQAISTAIIKQEGNLPKVFATAPAATTPTGQPTLAEIQAQRKIVEEANVAEQRKTGEDIAAQRASTIEAGSSAQERLGSINYLKGLLNNKETARAFGVINEPGVLNAILGAAEDGANLGNLGNAGIAGMSDAVRKAMPNATQTEIDAAQKATREFALMQLSAAKIYLKGQGAVSDAERKLIRELAGSVKNSPGALRDFLKWSETRADFDDKVGSAYRNFNKNNKNVSFERFLESDEYSTLKSQYVSELKKFGASTAPSSTSKTAHPGLSLVDKYAPKKAQ